MGDISPEGSSKNAAATARLAADADLILGLGDYQYETGTMASYNRWFDESWGANVAKMYPVLAPTHDQDWGDGDPLRYFNGAGKSGVRAAVRLSPHTSYSFDRGGWHFLAIDDSCYRNTRTCSRAALESWVRQDLAASRARCTIAYWHQPYWTSPTSEHDRFRAMRPVVQQLVAAGVDVLLAAHQHGYERFFPQDADSRRDDAAGLRQFVVGTGGARLYPYTGVARHSATRQADVYGVLRLTLGEASYSWRFAAEGGNYRDEGTATCH